MSENERSRGGRGYAILFLGLFVLGLGAIGLMTTLGVITVDWRSIGYVLFLGLGTFLLLCWYDGKRCRC